MFNGKRLKPFKYLREKVDSAEVVPSFHISDSHVFIIGGLAAADFKYVL